jgi:hypothetical protein
MLREHSDEITPEIDLPVAAVIIETMLEAILAHPVHAQDGTLAREATRLITRYLAVSKVPPLPLR